MRFEYLLKKNSRMSNEPIHMLRLNFVKKYNSLNEIFSDKGLAKLGDLYINFVYSLAKSKKNNIPTNERVTGKNLAEALKKAGLRSHLPSRMSRHDQGDAVESLIMYSWINEIVSIEECISILEKNTENPVEAFTTLINVVKKRLEVF